MLAFDYRFHGHGSLRFVYKNGRALRTHFFTLKYSLNPRRKRPRIAIVVSKKVLKSAVGRNRIRRRLYETIRLIGVDRLKPSDIVIIVSSAEITETPASELTKSLESFLKEANLYKPET